MDAGIADSFVLVAGRVFLQLSQDFLHAGSKRISGSVISKSGDAPGPGGFVYVWVCLWYFKGAVTATASLNPPDEGDDSFPATSQ